MATRYTLTDKNRITHTITIQGSKLVTNETPQQFPSEEAAQEHLERVLKIRTKEGYGIKVEEIDLEKANKTPEEDAAEDATFRRETTKNRTTYTLLGRPGEIAKGTCTKVIADIIKTEPTTVQLIADFMSPGKIWTSAMLDHKKKGGFDFITAFIFDTHFQTQTRQGENTIGDLSATLSAMPKVRKVFATGDLTFSATDHGSLAELYLLGDPLNAKLLQALAEHKLPKLERLVLSLASDAGAITEAAELVADAVVGLAKHAPKLRVVHVEALDDVTEALAHFANVKLPKGVRSLSLGGDIEDEDEFLAALEKHAAAFKSLESFGLPLDQISEPGAEAAAKLVTGVAEIDHDLALPAVYTDW